MAALSADEASFTGLPLSNLPITTPCRLYIEAYTNDESKFEADAQDVLKSIIGTALEVSKLQEFSGRDKPTVIT